jgi:hypothetical protein
MRLAILTVLAILLGATPALAQPSMTPPSEPMPLSAPLHPKSEKTARAYSVGGALLGPALIVIGESLDDGEGDDSLSGGLILVGGVIGLLGPSAGHWYAGKTFTGGMGLRVLGLATSMVGAFMLIDCSFDEDSRCNGNAPVLLMLGGAASYVIGTIWDVATADDAARAWNARHADVLVTPTAMPGGAGLALTGSF